MTTRAHGTRSGRRSSRGFTLVELMVAITGGMFIALAVFALARDGSRFYQHESRMSDATLAAIAGFERLKADVTRAGFLGTPNVRQDPNLCGDPIADPAWPVGLKALASVQLRVGGVSGNASPVNASLQGNGLNPDAIVLMGSYTGSEQFPIWSVADDGTQYTLYLQFRTGPLGRMGYATAANQVGMLTDIFGAGRAMRIQDQSGEIQFGTIQGVVGGATPAVVVSYAPRFRFRQDAGALCGLKGNVTGATVNPINFVRYDIRNLATTSSFGGANAAYQPVYDDGGAVPLPGDLARTELVRVELDTTGAPIQGTEELVAEHAVDLRFGVTAVTQVSNNTDPLLTTLPLGDPGGLNWAGDITANGGPGIGPHRLRSLRVRLAIRSKEADRDAPVTASATIAPGLYRFGMGPGGIEPYARVRTLQAEIGLQNQMGLFY